MVTLTIKQSEKKSDFVRVKTKLGAWITPRELMTNKAAIESSELLKPDLIILPL